MSKPPQKAGELRRQAEARLQAKPAKQPQSLNMENMQRLIHELEVHQIELEMQNEELCLTRDEMAKVLDKYTDLYEFAPVGYFTLNRNGIIHDANLTAAALLGVDRFRLTGLHFGSFIPENDKLAFADFREKVFTSLEKESCELTLTRQGKSPLIMQIEAIAFESGEECRFALIDVTERKQAEAEIRHLASFPLMNPNPILELDVNGQVTYCNPAAKLILEKEGNKNRTHPLIPKDIQVILQDLRENKAGQLYREVDINGRSFGENIYIAPSFQSVRIYTMDITERKRAEVIISRLNADLATRAADLENANRELEAFNYTVAHDLRTPLNTLSLAAQGIEIFCGEHMNEECKGFVRNIYHGTLHMNRLIDALLTFSRMGHVEPRREKVALCALAQEVVAMLQQTEPERQIDWHITAGIEANGDASLLRVVLDNLLGNAWKYTGKQEKTVIEFGVKEIDGVRTYFVRDNGVGFDKADAGKLFAPFQRLPGAETSKGFGIGLATVERIIRRHGGKIWAEGEPGKGATFSFTLATG
jgi:PAS domain S-box-containing protein